MLSEQNYMKILNYFDNHFWERKTDKTNWNYYGLILDWYFDESVLSYDHISIEDFFDCNGGFAYVDNNYLHDQYRNLPTKKCLKVLENILRLNIKNSGNFESGEIGLPMTGSKLVLPCGIYGRWEEDNA